MTLDPGSSIEIDCSTELNVDEGSDSVVVDCAPEPEPTPEPTQEPDPTATPQPEPDALVADYEISAGDANRFEYIDDGFVDGLEHESPYGVRTVQDSGPYDGWDVLVTDQYEPSRTLATDSWITLELSQPATVAVVWQAYEPLPGWLDDWENVGTPVVIEDSQSAKSRQVLEKEFDAGEVVLGGVYGAGEDNSESRSPYLVVLNESDGTDPSDGDQDDGGSGDDGDNGSGDDGDGSQDGGSDEFSSPPPWSAPPLTMVDESTLEEPQAGQECPAWVHKKHVTQGDDGLWYLTWHPAVDPEFDCHFGHEHGSNPDRVPGAEDPAFGSGTPDHIHESFYGYKVKAFNVDDSLKMLNTTHFGTAEPNGAACQRYHWNNFQFVENGEVVADLSIQADFGAAKKNDTDEPLNRDCISQRTGEPTDQYQMDQESNGVRLNPVCTGPNTSDCAPFYYPWRMSTPGTSEVMGLNSAAYTVNTPTVVAACEDMTCQENRYIGGTGAWAFVAFRTGFGVSDPGHSDDGVFYTNAYGDELLSADDPGAVRQYVKPGTNIQLTQLSDQHSWFPDKRFGGTVGDYMYSQLENGNPNIMDNHRAAVDPNGIIGDLN